MVTLEGRSYREQPNAAGVYHRHVNGTLVYWVKDAHYRPRAIWFSQIGGYWLIGKLEDLGSSLHYLESTSSMACPYSSGIEWKYWDGEQSEIIDARNTVQIFKSKMTQKSHTCQSYILYLPFR